MKLKYDKLLSNVAFKCNLRHYNVEAMLSRATNALEDEVRCSGQSFTVGPCRSTPG